VGKSEAQSAVPRFSTWLHLRAQTGIRCREWLQGQRI
jgi:hypothetical protein